MAILEQDIVVLMLLSPKIRRVFRYALAGAIWLSLAIGFQGCRCTTYTSCFRFAEEMNRPMTWGESSKIKDAFEDWDIALTVWSQINQYSGQGQPRNFYKIQIYAINESDSIYPGYRHLTVDHSIELKQWVCVDTVEVTFLPSGERRLTFVDSASVDKYLGSYRAGICYPFKLIFVPPEVDSIQISFNAHLYTAPGVLSGTAHFERVMYRYEAKGEGEYWWRRCG